jgi:hypothetical protein
LRRIKAMERTDVGIDYGNGLVNIDQETGVRYGVISQHEVLQAWADSSEPLYVYTCPYCGNELKKGQEAKRCNACHKRIDPDRDFDMLEPLAFTLNDGEYQAQCGDDGDIFILKSPYFTRCAFCSPCAPGAGYLMSPREKGVKAYCFGHDWFDRSETCKECYGTGNIGLETHIDCHKCGGSGEIDLGAPYPVYRVDTGEVVTL